MTRRIAAGLIAAVVALIAASVWHWRAAPVADADTVLVAGGDGGGLPRAEASAEGFDVAALQAAAGLANDPQPGGLLVMRHGHLVFEQYSGGAAADTMVAGGEFAATLLQLAAGVAVAQHGMVPPANLRLDAHALTAAIAAASGLNYPQFLSRNLWQALNAAPARCSGWRVSARAVDWLRVAELLLHDGRFEGTEVVPASWVRQLRAALPASGVGAEPFASDDTVFMRGPGATRLWLVPRLDLAILRFGGGEDALREETRLPNALIRALRDRPASTGVNLNDLVPGH